MDRVIGKTLCLKSIDLFDMGDRISILHDVRPLVAVATCNKSQPRPIAWKPVKHAATPATGCSVKEIHFRNIQPDRQALVAAEYAHDQLQQRTTEPRLLATEFLDH